MDSAIDLLNLSTDHQGEVQTEHGSGEGEGENFENGDNPEDDDKLGDVSESDDDNGGAQLLM